MGKYIYLPWGEPYPCCMPCGRWAFIPVAPWWNLPTRLRSQNAAIAHDRRNTFSQKRVMYLVSLHRKSVDFLH